MKELPNKGKSSIFDFIFVGFFMVTALGIGCLGMYDGLRTLVLVKISQGWPGVEGRIISSTMRESLSSSGSSNKQSSVYGADVKYTYAVNGQVLTGHRVNFGDYDDGDITHAQKILGRYPVGKMVTVYYSPKNPPESVLEAGRTDKGIIISFMVGAVFLLIGGFLLVLMILPSKRRRRAKQQTEPHMAPD